MGVHQIPIQKQMESRNDPTHGRTTPPPPYSSPSSDSIPSSLSADEREPFFISSSEVCCQKLEVKGLLGPHWFDAFLQRSAVKGQKLKVCCQGSAALGIYSQGKQ